MKRSSLESEDSAKEEEEEEVVFEEKEAEEWDINKHDEKNFEMNILLINMHNQMFVKHVIKGNFA